MLFRGAALLVFGVIYLIFSNAVEAQSTLAAASGSPKVERRSFTEPAELADPASSISVPPSEAARTAQAEKLNNLGVNLASQGRNEEAATVLQRAVGYDPRLANANLNLSIVYDRLDRYEDSLAAANRAVDARPDWVRARTQVCQLLLYLDRGRESLACYEQLRLLGPLTDVTLEGYGTALLNNGKFADAIDVLEQIIRGKPTDARVRTALGVAQYRKKKYSEALESFRAAIKLNPQAPQPRFNLAITSLTKGDRAEALNQYRFLQTADPDLAKELSKILFSDKVLVVKEK